MKKNNMNATIKQYTSWILSSLFLVLSSSCSKFLEEKSQDEMKPTTVRHLRELMNGSAYPYIMMPDPYVDLLTDDIKSYGLSMSGDNVIAAYQAPYDSGLPIFEWDVNMFDGERPFPASANSWKNYYEKIKGCNVILDHLDKVEGTIAEKSTLQGEAQFLRGFYYLKLVDLYAQPYTKAGVDKSALPGVPLILSSTVSDELPTRATIAEVYAQIEKDLVGAAALLSEFPGDFSAFRANKVSAWALLSRMYLYKGTAADWPKAVEYADRVLAERGILNQFSNQISSAGNVSDLAVYDVNNSVEVLWVYGAKLRDGTVYFPPLNINGKAPYGVSDELMALYEQGNLSGWKDLRSRLFFSSGTGQGYTYYTNKGPGSVQYGSSGIRVAEVYLNRAEAGLRLFIATGASNLRDQAISDLNYLVSSRYDGRSVVPQVSATMSGAALLQFCLTERRKELCLENGTRWSDIRRLGIPVEHKSVKYDGATQIVNLPADAALHALPIPFDVINANGNLEQNPRN